MPKTRSHSSESNPKKGFTDLLLSLTRRRSTKRSSSEVREVRSRSSSRTSLKSFVEIKKRQSRAKTADKRSSSAGPIQPVQSSPATYSLATGSSNGVSTDDKGAIQKVLVDKATGTRKVKKSSKNKSSVSIGPISKMVAYKQAITWVPKFDGSFEKYKGFANDCDTAFGKINDEDYDALLIYVKSQLDKSIFTFLLGTEIPRWDDLKKLMDEHYGIRRDEKVLFREITNLKRGVNEDLFKFYTGSSLF